MYNVEVNRRAEGTSELNRRLGAVEKGAAALERCGAAGDYGRALQESKLDVLGGGGQTGGWQACNRALPEPEAAERQKPERGLTFGLRGAETGGEVGCWSVPLEAIVMLNFQLVCH